MKLGMTFGLIGGVVALLFGIVLAFMGSALGSVGYGLGSGRAAGAGGALTLLGLGVPIAAIVGAALSFSSPTVAMALMGISGALILLLGISAELNWLLMAIGGLILAGAYFVYAETKKSSPDT